MVRCEDTKGGEIMSAAVKPLQRHGENGERRQEGEIGLGRFHLFSFFFVERFPNRHGDAVGASVVPFASAWLPASPGLLRCSIRPAYPHPHHPSRAISDFGDGSLRCQTLFPFVFTGISGRFTRLGGP